MLAAMVSRSRLKSLLTGLALYTMAAAMVGYFGVNAYTGKYGLNARQELDQEIIALTSELARLKRERAEGEQRVSLLRSDRVDPDMLDERARYQLDYANPHDLVRTITSELIVKLQNPAKSISKMSRRIALRHSETFATLTQSFHGGLSWVREGHSLSHPELPWPHRRKASRKKQGRETAPTTPRNSPGNRS